MWTRTETKDVPPLLRCCGYWSRRKRRWVGYCLELQLRAEGRDWDEVLERLVMSASVRLQGLQKDPRARRFRLAPFRVRLLYAVIATLHFVRPRAHWCLADVSPRLLVDET